MTEPSLALQKAIRARLVSSSAVTALVPALQILDKHARPQTATSIIIGDGQVVPVPTIYRDLHEVYADLHVWSKETSFVSSKTIVGAIKAALVDGPLSVEDHHVADLKIASTRFLRDPGGEHSHAVVTIEATLMETVT